MSKRHNSKPSSRIRNLIVVTFILALALTLSFGLYVLNLSAKTSQTLHESHSLNQTYKDLDDSSIIKNVDLITKTTFLFLSFGTVLLLGLMFNLMFSITPVLRRMAFAVEELGKGNFDFRLNLKIHNELGDIGRALNRALDKVLESEKALEVEKAGVERLVEHRTRQLNFEQSKFLASINGLPLGFILTDNNGHALMLNPAMERLLSPEGVDEADMVKKVSEGKFLKKLLNSSVTILKNGKTITEELTADDGRYMRILFSPISLTSEEFGGVVILVEDVTEAKVMERSKDEFFSIASHELRTPLTAIRGNSSLIQQFHEKQLKDKDLANMVEDIHSSSVRLITIVNDFLDVSRLEQGRITLKSQVMHIETVMESVVYEMAAVANENQLYVKTDTETLNKLPPVFADPDRVKQVLYNLVGNALKFVDKGGVSIETEVTDKHLKVCIIDTGRGISAENQQLLFHKFQQANTSLLTRDTTKGTGLGLYISKLLVEAMGGHIALEHSEEGKGSTFSFTLPLASKHQIENVQTAKLSGNHIDSETGLTKKPLVAAKSAA